MIDQTTIPVPFTTSACDRVLSAIRAFWREHGRSPSLGEVARRAAVRRQHVTRYLMKLQIGGYLTYDRQAAEPIVLIDPAANLSDLDLENGCHGRGWTIIKSRAPALAQVYSVDARAPAYDPDLLTLLR